MIKMENKKYITVFGATGKIGAALIEYLSGAEHPVIAVTRNKNKAAAMPFVEWMEADMANKESLYKTMENSKAVFLLSGHSPNFVEEQSNVIAVAKEQGVKHMVKLSSGAADENSPFYIAGLLIARVHADVEAILKTAGIPYTMLQPNGFMQNWLGVLSNSVKDQRKIYEATGDGKRAYLDLRDISEVAFKVLTEPEQHINKSYLLTGGEAVNFSQIAAIISKVVGEDVTYVQLSTDEARQQMEQKGIPQLAIQSLLLYAEAQRSGKTTYVSNAVPQILNKPARTVADFIKDYANWFK
jgi:NAD(P)H dehydrogenase (quinone)